VKETSAAAELFEETTAAKTGVRKWILPVIFLVLVPIDAPRHYRPGGRRFRSNVVLFVQRHYCTLVASPDADRMRR
jgi:hypothetical protein